jgi:hypothetical protein
MEREDVLCEEGIAVSYITYINVWHQMTHLKANYLTVMTDI